MRCRDWRGVMWSRIVSLEADDTERVKTSMLNRVWPVRLLRVQRRFRTDGEERAEEVGEDDAEEDVDEWLEAGEEPPAELSGLRR